MNKYFHHIGDFKSATTHLTRQEASVYLDLIHRYYDQEEPIMLDTKLLARKLARKGEEAKDIEPVIEIVLDEFFIKTADGYLNERCEFDLDLYRNGTSQKSKAGIASGKARKKKAKELKAKQIAASGQSVVVEQVLNTKEQVYTTKNDNQEPEPITSLQKFEEKDMKIAKHIYSKLLEANPKHKEPNLKVWAEDINKIARIDNRPYPEIVEVFNWANADDFWSTNSLSPSKLRKQYDTLLIKMRKVSDVSKKLILPKADDQLWPWAKQNGLPNPSPNEDYRQYRSRLQSLAEKKNNEG